MISYDDLTVGDALPELVTPQVSRTQLALFAGASGDHNPIHLDDEAARNSGLPGVIVHGMLSMAFLGQLVTGWAPQKSLRAFSTRFAAMNYPGDAITCRAKVVDKREAGSERLVDLELEAWNSRGDKTLAGSATIALG